MASFMLSTLRVSSKAQPILRRCWNARLAYQNDTCSLLPFGARQACTREPIPLEIKKVLVVNRVSRLDYESRLAFRRPWRDLNVYERYALRTHMTCHGFDLTEIFDAHREHAESLLQIASALATRQIEFVVVSPIVRMPSSWEESIPFTPPTINTSFTPPEDEFQRCDTEAPWWPDQEVNMEAEPTWEDDDDLDCPELDALERAFVEGSRGAALDGGGNAVDKLAKAAKANQGDSEVRSLGSFFYGRDLVITVGGHDVFLATALFNDGSIPTLGVNASPSTTSGRLVGCNAEDVGGLLERLARGHYTWVKRHRIGVSLRQTGQEGVGRRLRQSALSEIFVGERDPCRSSIVRVSRDAKNWDQVKCSGLLISTATGAAAWAASASTRCCCWEPRTDPGRESLIHAMASRAWKP
mmetsp:Transcript_72148/g.192864  ORF Transcript_72148/g.192864 Transcript_72148/m.192864 type:complete len:412 (-) Transcript_72148:41-1276(-)